MLGTVAVTDYGWYNFLRGQRLEEVNFWTPSDRKRFNAPELSPFFFKLKAPHRAIAGFGYFARWSSLPDWLAWDCFGVGNGCATRREFDLRLAEIRERIRYVPTGPVPSIGCILVVQPTFFPRDQWIPQPSDWHDRTVSSAGYDLTRGEGARIWAECRERAVAFAHDRSALPLVASPAAPRYGAPQTIVPRLGQGSFRVAVTDAYGRACAVTGEHSLPVLDAAHIRSYQADGPHEVRNGLLLRADLHRLFDKGYITVTDDRRVEVSPRLRADYQNGRTYYPLHGQLLRRTLASTDEPDPAYLRWHREHVYLGRAG